MALVTKKAIDGEAAPFDLGFAESGSDFALAHAVLKANGTTLINPATEEKQDDTITAVEANRPRFFNAAGTQLVRPANTTPYSQNDSISDNATAGSVTALSCTPSDANDDPICITEVILDTNDTGLAAGVTVRAWLYNSNPTASSGVVGGDNAAFSNKKAGFIGSLSGTFRAFSDGGKARLVPDEGSFIIANPVTGGVTIWAQFQVISVAGFTPSANSTTIDWRAKGFQGRA